MLAVFTYQFLLELELIVLQWKYHLLILMRGIVLPNGSSVIALLLLICCSNQHYHRKVHLEAEMICKWIRWDRIGIQNVKRTNLQGVVYARHYSQWCRPPFGSGEGANQNIWQWGWGYTNWFAGGTSSSEDRQPCLQGVWGPAIGPLVRGSRWKSHLKSCYFS